MKLKIYLIIILFNFNLSINSDEIIDQNKVFKNLRCLVCQGQSIADSNSDFALTLKMVVKDLIDQGKTEDEIYSFLSNKYGDWILYNPPFNSKNFMLWAIPYLALVFGGIIIVYLIRKRSKKT
tara:strand:- start:116 stop:484 length:369 start_codon:yes stop_codon:yes gene_type:complete